MSRVITLSGGQQIALESIDINIPEPFVDLFGRLRVSSVETQAQIKQDTAAVRDKTMTRGVVVANAGLTGTAVNNYFEIVSTGTGGHYRARSRICGLYQNGKSLLIFLTFNFVTNGTTGVKKRAGYFTGNDGVYLEQDGATVSWNLASSLDDLQSVPQTQWINNLTLDWTKAPIGVIAFEYLGVGDILCGFVQDRKIAISHIFSHKNALIYPYMSTPNLHLTYEMIVNRATTNTETFRIICASCMIEGGQQRQGFPFSINRLSGFNTASGARNIMVLFRNTVPRQRVLVDSFELIFGNVASALIELIEFATVANLPTSNGIVNGVESWLPSTATVTFTISSILASTLSTAQSRWSNSTINVAQYLETDYLGVGYYYGICVTGNVSSLQVQGSLVNFILEQ